MVLWMEWYQRVRALRPACSRGATFMWMVLALVGLSIRTECLGVTSFVRAIGLKENCYYRLLHLFHTPALNLEVLTSCWVKLVSVMFKPLKEGGDHIIVVDGLKVAKEGKKMPAVKKLHQESNNNSKPEYIWGHSFQILAMLVEGWCGSVFAVPLVSRIHEGIIFSNRDKRTLMDKMRSLLFAVTDILDEQIILVADNYYANKKVIKPLLEKRMHLVSRLRSNSVGYYPLPPDKKKGPGRKKIYGCKVNLFSFFEKIDLFTSVESPVYGEKKVMISFYSIELLWRPIGKKIRFVFVNHPKRGKIILMTTKLELDPVRVIAIYGYRFKIEVSFKQAIHTIGAYAFHFWMKAMVPIKRVSGDQHLHKKSDKYREQVKRKMKAYHSYVQMSCIAQGILLHLSINHGAAVWTSFRSWLRTMNKDRNPSEMVVSYALRTSLPEFLLGAPKMHNLEKFISKNADPNLMPDWRLYGTG